MPELPEVETIRRQLEPDLCGRRIDAVEQLDRYFTKPVPPADFEREVTGREVTDVRRRGKYLLLDLDSERSIVIHLRMTGSLTLVHPDGVVTPGDSRLDDPESGTRHLRIRFLLDDGGELWFSDPRRFGRGFVAGPDEQQEYFGQRLGVEPLSDEFTVTELARVSSGRTAPLKSFLLNQKAVAGIGNIYADEALFRARLHPLTPAGAMKETHHRALRDGVVAALRRGLDLGGASIDDYRDAHGARGEMQHEFLVHRREGDPCPECGTAVTRIVVGGRSTYFCKDCQVRLRRRR